MKILNPLMTVLFVVGMLLSSLASADHLPLLPLEDDDERDFWWYYQVQEDEVLEAMQEVVGADPVPISVEVDEPVQIGVIYPSQDVSDFWLRSFITMEARLEELGIPFETVQFASGMGDHQLQATYTDQVLEDIDNYDYVIFGPTELTLQEDNIKRLIDHPGVEVIIWNYDTVVQDWGDEQPLQYQAFSHRAGALIMCEYVIDRLGTEGSYALVRGTPGFIDIQRSGDFKACLEENSDWEMAYEHYGNFLREGGYEASQLILSAYPEVTLIHNANTAMAMGAVSSVLGQGRQDDIFVTAWGGTGDELEAIRLGELNATPMRMNDDLGVATAETIKYHLEGRTDEIPLVFLGRITIVEDRMSEEEIAEMELEAFRYSGIGTLER